jgi:sugar phosphate isomerase/epimerase
MSTMQGSFDEEVAAYAAVGFEGIGLMEMKLPDDDDENRRKIDEAGLQVSNCIIRVLTILPISGVVLPEANWRGIDFIGPPDTQERIGLISAAIERLAPYQPSSITVSFGSPDGYATEAEARADLIEGLKRIADVAGRAGTTLAIEPVHRSIVHTFGQTIAETAQIIDEADVAGPVGILVDTWHSGDQPGLLEDVAQYGDRITGVHLSDRLPDDPRRVAPGEGIAPVVEFLRGLRAHGYDSFVDAELFSPDDIWELPFEEAVDRAYRSTRSVVEQSAAVPVG